MLVMSNNLSVNPTMMNSWLKDNLTTPTIQEQLIAAGYDTNTIADLLKNFIQLKRKKRQGIGFIYMSIGAFLGFVSCTLTIINPIPSLYNIILYGLTSVAISLIFVGLYFVFED